MLVITGRSEASFLWLLLARPSILMERKMALVFLGGRFFQQQNFNLKFLSVLNTVEAKFVLCTSVLAVAHVLACVSCNKPGLKLGALASYTDKTSDTCLLLLRFNEDLQAGATCMHHSVCFRFSFRTQHYVLTPH